MCNGGQQSHPREKKDAETIWQNIGVPAVDLAVRREGGGPLLSSQWWWQTQDGKRRRRYDCRAAGGDGLRRAGGGGLRAARQLCELQATRFIFILTLSYLYYTSRLQNNYVVVAAAAIDMPFL